MSRTKVQIEDDRQQLLRVLTDAYRVMDEMLEKGYFPRGDCQHYEMILKNIGASLNKLNK